MDFLLVGSTGNLMQKLIDKLDKERHRVFVLTEEGKEVPGYRRTFETYRFSYNNACIREVFNSVKPDVTIFLGAYDWNFNWESRQGTSVDYSSAILNMLMAFSAQQKGKFIYLSSEEVFGGLSINEKNEVMNRTEQYPKAQAVAMGEKMCLDYGRMVDETVVVLRLDHLYGIPTRREEIDNICARMCMEAIDTGEITIDGDKGIYVEEAEAAVETIDRSHFTVEKEKEFSPVYLADAVEYIYQVAAAKEYKQSVYQVSGSRTVTQAEIAGMIKENLQKGPNGLKASKKSKEQKESKKQKESKEQKESKKQKEPKEQKESKKQKEPKEQKESKKQKKSKEQKESKKQKKSKEQEEAKEQNESKELPESKGQGESKEPEKEKAAKEPGTSGEWKELEELDKTKESDEDGVQIVNAPEKGVNSVVLSGFTFMEEFHLKSFNPPGKAIPKLVEYLQKNAAQFSRRSDMEESLTEKVKRGFREIVKLFIPFLENMVMFIPFFMLNNRAVGSKYFTRLDFYLLYVLLFAIVYGQQQAIFSSLLAIAGYCFRQMYQRTGFDVMLDYNTYVWMAQILILGLVVGYMRDQLRSIREEHAGEIQFLTKQLADLSEINGSNVRVKDVLSDHLLNQNDSMGKIYEITSELGSYQPAEVLFYAAEVLSKIMRSKDVAIYSVANRSYARLFSATSDRARILGNSVNYSEMTDLYGAIQEHKVYINKNMTEKYPLMASAIYEGDEMQMILMVWDIPWERMTLGQADMLAITGHLIQDAVLRANRYMAALEQQRYIQGTHILEPEAFEELLSAFMRARSRNLTTCALLNLEPGELSQEEVNEKLSKLVRQTDYLGQDSKGKLHVLLANTDVDGARFVQKRFEDVGMGCQVEEALVV
ncbi:MAG: NAD-dependent epimerase/dehydratase [Blautia sp.]|nr:NAD-dependent epimerase/dehydratase [Blautia sp.]